MDSLINKQIIHYKIEKVIGEGRFGPVYQGVDLRCSQALAIKLIKPEILLKTDIQKRLPALLSQAIYEQSPGLVCTFAVEAVENNLLVITELINGPTLANLLLAMRRNKRWISAKAALELVVTLGNALSTTQIRRRLVPSKIKFHIEGRSAHNSRSTSARSLHSAIVDLGIDMDSEIRAKLTNQNVVISSILAYLPPEELQGKPGDERGDVYSLAALAFELLSGEQLLTAEISSDALHVIMNEDLRLRQRLPSELPDALVNLLEKALQKKSLDRLPSLGELVNQIQEFIDPAKAEVLPISATAGITALLTEFESYEEEPKVKHAKQVKLVKEKPEIKESKAADVGSPSPATSAIVGVEIIEPSGQRRVVTISQPNATIGRVTTNPIFLPDDAKRISRAHAEMRFTTGYWHIVDLKSGNGTLLDGELLVPERETRWSDGATVKIEEYQLQLVKAPADQPRVDQGVDQHLQSSGSQIFIHALGKEIAKSRIIRSHGDERIGIFLDGARIEVEPGKRTQVTLIAINFHDIPLALMAEPICKMPGQILVEPATAQLRPGEQRQLIVTIEAELSGQCRKGTYPLQMLLANQLNPEESVSCDIALQVSAFTRYDFHWEPEIPTIGDRLKVTVHNQGNSNQEFVLSLWDDKDEIQFEPRQSSVPIAPGESKSIEIHSSIAKAHWFGKRQHQAVLQISAANAGTQTRTIEFVSRGSLA